MIPRLAAAQTDAAASPPPSSPVVIVTPPPPSGMPVESMQQRALSRAPFIYSACREAATPDYFMWITAGALIAAGGTLAAIGLSSTNPTPTLLNSFIVGVGPGLVLGGIGEPFARGVIDEPNPLATTCRALLRTRPGTASADDLNTIDRLLLASGRPDTAVLPLLLGAATLGTGIFAAIAIAFGNNGLTQLSGGIAAAVVTGWFLVPHTPQRAAALRYTHRMATPDPIGGVPTPVAYGLPNHGFGAGLSLRF